MAHHVIIDGNNLLHAMFNHAQIRSITRTALLESLKPWARRSKDQITLVFDGPAPRDGFDKPLNPGRIELRFAAPHSADDIIVRMIHAAPHPERLRVVSSDTAIAYEARRRRGVSLSCEVFLREVFPEQESSRVAAETDSQPEEMKGDDTQISQEEADYWLSEFGFDGDTEEDDPFEGRI